MRRHAATRDGIHVDGEAALDPMWSTPMMDAKPFDRVTRNTTPRAHNWRYRSAASTLGATDVESDAPAEVADSFEKS